MKAFSERLNDRLEQQRRGELQSAIPGSDPEVDELALLAHRLRTAPHVQVDRNFAQQLERRMLAHHAVQVHRRATTTHGNWLFQRGRSMQLALGFMLVCLLLLVGTAGTFVAAAQATNPHNPLYQVKLWMQQWKHPQVNAAMVQADTNWRSAHNQLHTLASLADPAHAVAYQQALVDLDQYIHAFTRSIQALPAGPERDSFTNKLVTLKADARRTLRGLLPRLTLAEQLLTTDELGRLNDTVPHVDSAMVVVVHAQKQATITISGEHLQAGMQLFVDHQLVATSGSLHNGTGVFTVSWTGGQPPKTIGILNPDGTAAQTTTITFTLADGNGNGNGKDNGNNGNTNKNSGGSSNGNANKNNSGNNSNGNGNGNGKGKSVATPTPTPTP